MSISQKDTAASVRYTLTVWITVPMEEDDDPAGYRAADETHRLEHAVIRACRTLDGDVDAECIETDVLDADGQVVTEPNPRERGDDDGAEYSDPRDARAERRS